uniref:Uncharacterized protein n=1 Tax=Anguilla anguilla TaxID=7936 RepID=A0A0E9WNG4_ANGAN
MSTFYLFYLFAGAIKQDEMQLSVSILKELSGSFSRKKSFYHGTIILLTAKQSPRPSAENLNVYFLWCKTKW